MGTTNKEALPVSVIVTKLVSPTSATPTSTQTTLLEESKLHATLIESTSGKMYPEAEAITVTARMPTKRQILGEGCLRDGVCVLTSSYDVRPCLNITKQCSVSAVNFVQDECSSASISGSSDGVRPDSRRGDRATVRFRVRIGRESKRQTACVHEGCRRKFQEMLADIIGKATYWKEWKGKQTKVRQG